MTEEDIKELIKKQIELMSINIRANYDVRETKNVFQAFNGEHSMDVIKYMSLGRSFDSQLGNRLQKICKYIARDRFGWTLVPDYIFAEISDTNDVVLYLFSYPKEFIDKFGIDACKTQSLIRVNNKNCIFETILNKTIVNLIRAKYREDVGIKQIRKQEDKDAVAAIIEKVKKRFEEEIIEYTYANCSNDKVKKIKGITKKIDIDLIYFTDDNSIYMYEIKASGGLDTKNREGNANEVTINEQRFSFIKNVYSYFAACYNNSGEDEGKIKNEKGIYYRGSFPYGPLFNMAKSAKHPMHNKIIVGSVFWEKILPESLKFSRFLEIYKQAFVESGIEDMIYEL